MLSFTPLLQPLANLHKAWYTLFDPYHCSLYPLVNAEAWAGACVFQGNCLKVSTLCLEYSTHASAHLATCSWTQIPCSWVTNSRNCVHLADRQIKHAITSGSSVRVCVWGGVETGLNVKMWNNLALSALRDALGQWVEAFDLPASIASVFTQCLTDNFFHIELLYVQVLCYQEGSLHGKYLPKRYSIVTVLWTKLKIFSIVTVLWTKLLMKKFS